MSPPRLVERSHDPSATQRLMAAGFAAPLARALAARGIATPAQLAPALNSLHPPSGLAQCEHAAGLLADAIESGRRLLIVADYDCDGATACAVGVRGLRALGAQVDFLVPNRFEFGYGLTPELVDLAAQRHPDWIITVDNGIGSIEGVARANQLGIDVMITDHHLPGSSLPQARAIVNPNQNGCGFASKHLAGVGVMFYLLMALRAEMRTRGRFESAPEPNLGSLLDLVALGTVADLVRLDHNNRALVCSGIENIRRGRVQPGIAALFQVAGRDARTARCEDLGFAIGPRLNAAGRLTDMSLGIECLLCDDHEHAVTLARRLDDLNRERRQLQAQMQSDALNGVDTGDFEKRCSIVLFDERWHPGIVGLVASKVKERHHRPTIAFAKADAGRLRGSGRSIEGLHLRDTIDRVTKLQPSLVERFGGHAMAAGLTLHPAAFDAFADAFESATRQMADRGRFTQTLQTDGPLQPDDLNPSLVDAIDALVWGQGFPPPLFVNDFAILEQRLVQGKHLQLVLGLHKTRVAGIWFGCSGTLPGNARLVYRPRLDSYRGVRKISLQIECLAP